MSSTELETFVLSGKEIESTLSSRDLLLSGEKGARRESVEIDAIYIEETLYDQDHAEELQKSMEGEWGQLNDLLLRARFNESGEVVYDVIDGFHRSAGLKGISEKRGIRVSAKAKVLYGCSDTEMYDLRVLAAGSVRSVRYARTVEWMRRSFDSQIWQNPHLKQHVESGVVSLSEVFMMTHNKTITSRKGLTESEVAELIAWGDEKSGKWGKPAITLYEEMHTAEIASPDLVRQVRLAGGGGRGRSYLTHARLKEVANAMPHQYRLQERVVEVVLQQNITAKNAGALAAKVAELAREGNESEIDSVLANPSVILEGMRSKDEASKNNSLHGEVYISEGENGLQIKKLREQLSMQAQFAKAQEEKIRSLIRAEDKPREPFILAHKVGTDIVFDPNTGDIISTGSGYTEHLTPMEAKILHTLVSYPNTAIDFTTLFTLVWDEPIIGGVEEQLRPHISNLRNKIGRVSPLLKDQLENIRGAGYRWISAAQRGSSLD